MAKRNPPWQKQEIILALNLYLKNRKKGILSGRTPDMKDLAVELNELGKSIHYVQCERTADSVYMKILNLVSLDPSNASNGRPNGGKLDRVVWDEFGNNPQALKREVALIREVIQLRKNNVSATNEITDEFKEGGVLYRLHRERERNSKVVSQLKEAALAQGNLICEVCGMDFYQTYGELGKGYIECHHKVPLYTYEPNQKTSKKDLALVCANCHRMLHRNLATLAVEDLKQIVQNRN